MRAMEKKEDNYARLKEFVGEFGDIKLKNSSKGSFTFPVYLTKDRYETEIEVLDLSVRANNSLKRSGIRTIGELVERYPRSGELNSIRGCGASTKAEICEKLFFYNYNVLSEERKKKYMDEVILLNTCSFASTEF